eukprot:3700481-Prymnesium_polylepis.1
MPSWDTAVLTRSQPGRSGATSPPTVTMTRNAMMKVRSPASAMPAAATTTSTALRTTVGGAEDASPDASVGCAASEGGLTSSPASTSASAAAAGPNAAAHCERTCLVLGARAAATASQKSGGRKASRAAALLRPIAFSRMVRPIDRCISSSAVTESVRRIPPAVEPAGATMRSGASTSMGRTVMPMRVNSAAVAGVSQSVLPRGRWICVASSAISTAVPSRHDGSDLCHPAWK